MVKQRKMYIHQLKIGFLGRYLRFTMFNSPVGNRVCVCDPPSGKMEWRPVNPRGLQLWWSRWVQKGPAWRLEKTCFNCWSWCNFSHLGAVCKQNSALGQLGRVKLGAKQIHVRSRIQPEAAAELCHQNAMHQRPGRSPDPNLSSSHKP